MTTKKQANIENVCWQAIRRISEKMRLTHPHTQVHKTVLDFNVSRKTSFSRLFPFYLSKSRRTKDTSIHFETQYFRRANWCKQNICINLLRERALCRLQIF